MLIRTPSNIAVNNQISSWNFHFTARLSRKLNCLPSVWSVARTDHHHLHLCFLTYHPAGRVREESATAALVRLAAAPAIWCNINRRPVQRKLAPMTISLDLICWCYLQCILSCHVHLMHSRRTTCSHTTQQMMLKFRNLLSKYQTQTPLECATSIKRGYWMSSLGSSLIMPCLHNLDNLLPNPYLSTFVLYFFICNAYHTLVLVSFLSFLISLILKISHISHFPNQQTLQRMSTLIKKRFENQECLFLIPYFFFLLLCLSFLSLLSISIDEKKKKKIMRV